MKKYIVMFNILLFLFSCTMDSICKRGNKTRLNQNCNIIVRTWDKETGILRIRGVDRDTGKLIGFQDDTRGYQGVVDYISAGDTVIKKKGELKLYVNKKDSIIICNVEDFCKKINDPNSDYLTFIKR